MDKAHRHIDILLFDGLNILDVAGAAQAFSSSNDICETFYRLRYVSIDGASVMASCGLGLTAERAGRPTQERHDLLIPGGRGIDSALKDGAVSTLAAQWSRSAGDRRLISVCSGALLLAQAGLLNGRQATTHWNRAQQARAQFPKVDWNTNLLYCGDDHIMTAAGVSSGIDLALAIVRRDRGAKVALRTAQEMVVYLQRSGGQHQFADLLEAQFSDDAQIGPLVDVLIDHPQKDWTLEKMASAAGLTPRTLTRRFTAAFHRSPIKFLERIRVRRAADAISGGVPIGKAIEAAGFSDFQQMQRAFKRQLGSTIGAYQRRFGDAGEEREAV